MTAVAGTASAVPAHGHALPAPHPVTLTEGLPQ